MVMKDKLNKVGRKVNPVFNRKNILIAFVTLVIFASVAIPAYFTVGQTVANAKGEDKITLDVSYFGEYSLMESTNILTYKN